MTGEAFVVRTKRVRQASLTSECWPVQVWGLAYCSGFGNYPAMCEYLATDECGGQVTRRRIIGKTFPVSGLPDAGPAADG